MALPTTVFSRSRALSRRDHVLNLLPPLSVVTKEEGTMHDRLFSDEPPPKNYTGSFPNKVLRHLGPWTFYSAPTRGELALIDKNMYDLESQAQNSDKTASQDKGHDSEPANQTGEGKSKVVKHAHGTVSNSNATGHKYTKGKTSKVNTQKETIELKKNGENTTRAKGRNTFTKQSGKQGSNLSSETKTAKSDTEQILQLKRQVNSNEEKSDHGVANTKTTKRQSNPKSSSNKPQNDARVNRSSRAHVTKVELTLKQSRGKLLGDAEGACTDTDSARLAVEGFTVQGTGRNSPRNYQGVRERYNDVTNTGNNRESTTSLTGRSEDEGKNHDMYTPSPTRIITTKKIEIPLVELDEERIGQNDEVYNEERQVVSPVDEVVQEASVSPGVVTTPVEVNETSEQLDGTGAKENKLHSTKDEEIALENEQESCETEPKEDLAAKPENSSKKLCINSETTATIGEEGMTVSAQGEKEPALRKDRSIKERPKTQSARRKQRKQSGKGRVRSS